MTVVRDLVLWLVECSGIESVSDVLDVASMVADLGLRPGVGTYTATTQPEPVEDVRRFVPTTHYVTPGIVKPDRRLNVERWEYGTVWPSARGVRCSVTISRRGGARDWDVAVRLLTWSYEHAGVPLPDLAGDASALLERIGTTLYPRVMPALGMLYSVGDDDVELPRALLDRKLAVGWRTWYGPSYVEKYGRELLLGLPDRTALLDDDGITQALDVAPLDLVTGGRGVYAGVGAYLAEHDIRPAWPRLPRPKSGATPPRQQEAPRVVDDPTADATSLDAFQDDVRALLSNAIVLDTGLRVLMLPLAWSELDGAQQTIVYSHLRQVAEFLLTEHPGSRVRFEFTEIPADLRELLSTTYPADGPVSYGLLTDPPPL